MMKKKVLICKSSAETTFEEWEEVENKIGHIRPNMWTSCDIHIVAYVLLTMHHQDVIEVLNVDLDKRANRVEIVYTERIVTEVDV